MFRVIGLDLSLTSPGLSDCCTHFVHQTDAEQPLEQRIQGIVAAVREFALFQGGRKGVADLAVIEGAAWSKQKLTGHEELSGVRLIVRCELWKLGVPFAIVPPTTLKMYTTGHGKATKAQMVSALKARHGLDLSGVKVTHGKYDMADAYALAAMGYAHMDRGMDRPVPFLPHYGPPPPMKSLLAVTWPPVPVAA